MNWYTGNTDKMM